jgi:hypothetical protein
MKVTRESKKVGDDKDLDQVTSLRILSYFY